MEAAGPQLANEARDAGHAALEAGGAAADVVSLVGVAGGDGGQAETIAKLPREGVLAGRGRQAEACPTEGKAKCMR